MELDTSILTDLAATLHNPVALATLIGIIAYALMEILKGFVPWVDQANVWVKRGIVAGFGMILGVALTVPITEGLPVWPDGILSGFIGSLVMATARGLGQNIKTAKKTGATMMLVVLLMFPLAGCGFLQICDEPSLTLRDGDTPTTSTIVFQCGGQDIVSKVIPTDDLAGLELCENPTVALRAAAGAGQSSVVIECGGVTLLSFLVDSSYFQSSGKSAAIVSTTNTKSARVRTLRINGGCHGNR